MNINLDRPHYKLEVDRMLRGLPRSIILPNGPHPMWQVIELCHKNGKSVHDAAVLVQRLYTILGKGNQ